MKSVNKSVLLYIHNMNLKYTYYICLISHEILLEIEIKATEFQKSYFEEYY